MATSFGSANPIFPVKDLAASLAYYTEKLGFEHDWGERGIASASRGDCRILLTEWVQGQPGSWVWIGVDDAGALHEELVARGAKIRFPPTNYRWAFEVHVEHLEEGERVGRTSGKPTAHLSAEQRAHLAGAVLAGRLAESDLAVAADRDASVAQHREYRGGTDLHGVLPWAATQPPRRVRARGWAASKLARSRLRPRWV